MASSYFISDADRPFFSDFEIFADAVNRSFEPNEPWRLQELPCVTAALLIAPATLALHRYRPDDESPALTVIMGFRSEEPSLIVALPPRGRCS